MYREYAAIKNGNQMINTKCRWCKREVNVNWEPFTNEFLKANPMICFHCKIEMESGWWNVLVNFNRKPKIDMTVPSAQLIK